MQSATTAVDMSTRPPIRRIAQSSFLLLGSLLTGLVSLALAWGDDYSTQLIVPGVGIGPARLGMMDAEARTILEVSHLTQPECSVDVFTRNGRVIALGTRFGGCLEVPLPTTVGRVAVVGRTILPEVGGIGGSPAPFIRAFGNPSRIQIDSKIAILLWSIGLVARITVTGAGELITYLAVVPAISAMPPYALLP